MLGLFYTADVNNCHGKQKYIINKGELLFFLLFFCFFFKGALLNEQLTLKMVFKKLTLRIYCPSCLFWHQDSDQSLFIKTYHVCKCWFLRTMETRGPFENSLAGNCLITTTPTSARWCHETWFVSPKERKQYISLVSPICFG